ncbi:HAD-IIB family hydrolase [Lacticaseibacillus hulanensis]|uniref:HAD-IIB family hydrolase n=1 Tax=Lacticaseibacillus hulanensis TaxID=2493111 RepID=UPI000FD958F3|nr:HAD family hydrolase [Lacticaseibacillus hulanensis]
MIKLAGLDLDGTLYDRHLRVSKFNRNAVRAWAASGRLLAVCSGRMIPRVAALLDDDLQVRGYRMCLNGALVYNQENKLIAARPLAKTTARRVFLLAKKYGVRVRFYSELYHALVTPHAPGDYLGGELNRDVHVSTMAQLDQLLKRPDVQFYKFTLEAAFGNVVTLGMALRALKRLPLNMTRSKTLLFEGLAPGVDKLFGMKTIAADAGVSLDECLCIGDQLNDLTMIRGVGCGVAMGNAVREVKDAAHIVAPRNTKNGAGVTLLRVITGDIGGADKAEAK